MDAAGIVRLIQQIGRASPHKPTSILVTRDLPANVEWATLDGDELHLSPGAFDILRADKAAAEYIEITAAGSYRICALPVYLDKGVKAG